MPIVSEGSKAMQDYFGFAQRTQRDPHDGETRRSYLENIAAHAAYTNEERDLCRDQSKIVLETRIRMSSPAQPVLASGDGGPNAARFAQFSLDHELAIAYENWCERTDRVLHRYDNVQDFLDLNHGGHLAPVRSALAMAIPQAMYAVWNDRFSRSNDFKERLETAWKPIGQLMVIATRGHQDSDHQYIRNIIFSTENAIKYGDDAVTGLDGTLTQLTRSRLEVLNQMVNNLRRFYTLFNDTNLKDAVDQALVPFTNELAAAFPEATLPRCDNPENYDEEDD